MNKNTDDGRPDALVTDPGSRKSGRAVFTEDGRSTWEWQTATGVFTKSISAEQLDSLQASHLRIVEPAPPAADESWTSVGERFTRASVRSNYPPVQRIEKNTGSGLQQLFRRLTGAHRAAVRY